MMQQALVHGRPLAWRDEGNGPTVLCLHANPGDSRDFDAIAPVLARRFRVIRPDWPGYGSSTAPVPPESAGALHFFDTLREFIETLKLRDVVLIGNSVGGNAAVRYALHAPANVRGLVLVSPGGFTRHNPVTRLFCRLQGNVTVNRRLAPMFTRSYLALRTPCTRAMIERAGSEQSSDAARRVNAAVWRSFLDPQHNLLDPARAVRAPTLVASGARDPVIPANKDGRHAAAAIPGARQVVFACGHAPFAELPEAFLAEVLPFLDSIFAAQAQRAAG
jgi:pimeloyl-ACP methyl ester carboxylesterase